MVRPPVPPRPVVVLGEVLVELSGSEPFGAGRPVRLGFSGDALNAAAAAAAAGAHTLLVARVPADELGDALLAHAGSLGIDTSTVRRVPGQHGVYFSHADPAGARQFVYVRAGSAGSGLAPSDLDPDLLRSAVVLAGGVACAISASAAAAVRHAAELAALFVYDPNYRPRLTTAAAAADALRAVAPRAALITPSWPDEASALLGLPTHAHDAGAGTTWAATGRAGPRRPAAGLAQAVAALRALGAGDVALTCGADGVVLAHGEEMVTIPAAPAPVVVDQTGAGDSLVGTVVGRLACGDDLVTAVRLGVAAAALSVGGLGGTGHVPTVEETRHHARWRSVTASDGRPLGAGR